MPLLERALPIAAIYSYSSYIVYIINDKTNLINVYGKAQLKGQNHVKKYFN